MRINITARHLNLTNSLADYIQKKVEKCQKYFDHVIWAHVIISVEKTYRHVAEIIIHAGKTSFRAKDESIDMYAAVDLAIDRIVKQLHKRKEIMKESHKSRNAAISKKIRLQASYNNLGKETKLITETKKYEVKPMSVREAVDVMEALGEAYYMFMNEKTSQVSVVYKASQDSYGLIEPRL